MVNWKATRDLAHSDGDGWGYWLMDKKIDQPVADLHGMVSITMSEKINQTTAMKMVLPSDHPAVDLLLPVDDIDEADPGLALRKLMDERQFIITEGPGGESERMVWVVARITQTIKGVQREEWEYSEVTVECKSLYRYIERLTCRADPNMPLIAQLSYRDFRAGDSLRVIKEYMLVNLMREFQPNGIQGWDMWNVSSWSSVNQALWPAMVCPVHDTTTSVATVLDARFDAAASLFASTLDAAGLMLTVILWLEGDAQPAPLHTTLTKPTIWIDVRSRQFDTSTTGGFMDILHGLVRTFDTENNVPRVGLGDTPATWADRLPWVVWRPSSMAGSSLDLTVVKSEDAHVTVGGRSPEVLNKLIGAGSKSLFQGLAAALAAAVPQFAPLIVAAGSFLGDLSGQALQDKLFAWNGFEDAVRREAHGFYRYRDVVGNGDGWTLSAWQQGFQMLKEGAGMISGTFTGGENLAYKWGRDFRAGDQQGFVYKNVVFSTFVSEVTLTWTVDKGWREAIVLGDPRARESRIENLKRTSQSIKEAIDRVKSTVL